VLVVEDDIDSARSLTWILRDMGHDVEYAINGYVAVDIAGMNGFEVCKRLRRMAGLEGTRVIAISAYAQDEYRSRSKEVGCDAYIVKPLDPAVLEMLLD
jgi:DNA-binding response OmpR family regulator